MLTTHAVLTSSAVRPLTGCGDDCDKLASTYERSSICVDSGSRLDREGLLGDHRLVEQDGAARRRISANDAPNEIVTTSAGTL